MKPYIIILFALCSNIFWSCEPDALKDPIDGDSAIPGQVSNVQVKNIAGGATISYDTPNDGNLLYVRAEYSIREGVVREAKASYYDNSLTVEGFPTTDAYTVKLYSVNRNEGASEPVTVTINPLTPPVKAVYESLHMEETYGGVRLYFENESESNVVITVFGLDSYGDPLNPEIYYTKRASGTFAARGFEAEKQSFFAFVRDRWNNLSDTLYGEYTPLPEQQLDKSKFKALQLTTDTYEQHCCGTGMVNLWDGSWAGSSVFHTKPGTGLPQWFSFDMGQTASLSRFKFYHRKSGGQGATDGAYTGGDPKEFELYGSNNPVNDGTWDSWTLIGTFTSTKPSRSPEGTVTAEDYKFAVLDGEEFDIPPGTPPYRYLRWKTNKVWGALDHHYIEELTFWGDPQTEDNEQ